VVEAELITPAVVDRAWPYLRATHPFMVVDGGNQLSELTLTVLERSHVILLVVAPELASVKTAVDSLQVFGQLGYGLSQVMPVVNWIFPHHGISQKQIETALSCQIAGMIPHDGKAFVQAINTGQPCVLTNPTSKSSLAIASLAYELSSTEMESLDFAHSSQLLTWVRKLAKAA
jgi:Flp pilus assembly CpaE family ATPase